MKCSLRFNCTPVNPAVKATFLIRDSLFAVIGLKDPRFLHKGRCSLLDLANEKP